MAALAPGAPRCGFSVVIAVSFSVLFAVMFPFLVFVLVAVVWPNGSVTVLATINEALSAGRCAPAWVAVCGGFR
jgi:lipopolysaccharide export LptBFGC system permease protein LptF